jgi:cell division septation protein DedD
MTTKLGPPSVRPDPRRGRIRQWTLLIAILALIWSVGAGMEYAIRSSAPSSEEAPSSPPRPIVTPAPLAAGVSVDAERPDMRATAPSNTSAHDSERRVAEINGRKTLWSFERGGPAGYAVQVAAVPDLEEARTLREQLIRAGYPVYLTTTTINQVRLYRVRVGPFPAKQTAQQAARRLVIQGYHAPWITK